MTRIRKYIFIVVILSYSVLAGCRSTDSPQTTDAGIGRVTLFNGRDFIGWKRFVEDKDVDVKTVWSIKDKAIHCIGKPRGYIRTEAEYADYKLHVEWRWPQEPGNSGILFHATGPDKLWPKCFECQLSNTNAGDFIIGAGLDFKEWTDKSTHKVRKKAPSSEKPPGQWNIAEIYCSADTIRIFINGVLQNQATQISDTSGKIGLQSEGRPIQFRNIYIEPL